ncbi:MAG: T9SS type A sorting domain-containing protein [Ignavibacteriae bacterium]|nr:T9SS type A sorting domain-containing protein [Ignavibacteriota bacterium]
MVRTSGGALIAGDARKGIYSSTDDGQTWILKKKLHEREPQFGFLIAVGGDGNVYAAKTGPEPGLITKFFVSSNNGEAWRQRSVRRNPNSITTPIFSSLFALPGSQLFAGDFSRGVIVCSTLGRSWRQLNSGLSTEVGTFSLTFGPDGHLYAGTSSGLYRSSQAASATLPIALGEGYYSEPKSFALSQNYPNPFNPTTSIGFDLAGMSRVTLKVYNTLGQEVVTVIHNELMDEGAQEVEFDASTLPSGAYFYRLTAERLTDEGGIETGGAFTAMKKMLLLK